MCHASCICAALVVHVPRWFRRICQTLSASCIVCVVYYMSPVLPESVLWCWIGICSGQCACTHTSFVIQLYQSLLYHFIHACVCCKCISLVVVSSIVSVSSLIQALSSMLCIVFMVQLIVVLLHVHNQCPITVSKFIINCG